MCKLIAQTFATPYEWIFERSKEIGIEKVVEILENQAQNEPNY
jgi:hypothetical protein